MIAAILARNEADRYLRECLESLVPVCDHILLLDDGSTDGTIELAESFMCHVKTRKGPPMWGQESSARQELWEWAAKEADDGWLLIADADQELMATREQIAAMESSWDVTAWGIPLYDLWDAPDRFRSDGHWGAYRVKRPWMFRPAVCETPIWGTRGLHVGHAPANFPYVVGHAPEGVYWKHYGWMRKADRDCKLERYLAHKDQLNQFELAHLLSVNDDPLTYP